MPGSMLRTVGYWTIWHLTGNGRSARAQRTRNFAGGFGMIREANGTSLRIVTG